uniref:Predicted gene 10337 n=3 Tax=Murinae TaxID=39107 RepID=F7DEP7_MOUSE
YQMSTFSDTGSFLITSGAIQATVPAKDILVLLSLSSLEVPKSEIFTTSSYVISML